MTKAKNAARRWLAVADVTPPARRVGRFMADHARFATAADVRRKVKPGEVFCSWSQARVAIGLGVSERQIMRGVRSLRSADVIAGTSQVPTHGVLCVHETGGNASSVFGRKHERERSNRLAAMAYASS